LCVAGKKGELHGELVVGMGEALVGNYPGRALSFSATAGGEPQLLSLPGKRQGLFAKQGVPHLIARSDSNGARIMPLWRSAVRCCSVLSCAVLLDPAA
jgi:alpha-glucan,water dikinase